MSETIAVLGSGTMGSSIAQAALVAGFRVTLYDVSLAAVERARNNIAVGLTDQGRSDAAARLYCTTALDEIAGATLVIEAVPENLELKQSLFAKVGLVCPAPAIIASNTSALPITALAAACPRPQRVAGLHFFNPVHRMALIEVIRAMQTDEATIKSLMSFSERLGKTPVLARDTPGFIVNRVMRPFFGEGLRLFSEGAASVDAIDAALHLAGGFPLGPFALMDLIGIDVNLTVTQTIYEQNFHEPRYRPHPIQQQMVLQGTLGRKTGRGFYPYDRRSNAGERRLSGPEAASSDTQEGQVGLRSSNATVLLGNGTWAPALAELCAAAGLGFLEELPYPLPSEVRAAFVVAGREENAADQVMILDRQLHPDLPLFAQCADTTASALASLLHHPERLVGFDGLFTTGAITLVATPVLSAEVRVAADALVRGLGRRPIWITDTPGLIVPRIVATLANEAAFAVGEGVADVATVDLALRLGANHPIGPLARAAKIGYGHIVTVLDHLYQEYHEERYRVAPALRRAARVGKL